MGGAPYGPMAGQGANNSSNSHTAAAFLHTTDQGGEIVGDSAPRRRRYSARPNPMRLRTSNSGSSYQ